MVLFFFLSFQCEMLLACSQDSDCRVDEKCMKREKNAYGICIKISEKKFQIKNNENQPKIRIIQDKKEALDYLGTTEENLRAISPSGKIGQKCHSTSDCNGTEECIIAGFEGRCISIK